MNIKHLLLSLTVSLLCQCSLVTVPVKTVGSLAETTVTTVGGVAKAPFTRGQGKEDEKAKEPPTSSQQ